MVITPQNVMGRRHLANSRGSINVYYYQNSWKQQSVVPLKYHWTTTSIWVGLYALQRLIQPPWIELQLSTKRPRSCPPFSSFPSRGLPVEFSLQSLASHFSRWKHLCAPGNTFKNLTSATSTLQDLLYDMGYGLEKSKNLEAEDLGSGPGPAGYQLSCVVLA